MKSSILHSFKVTYNTKQSTWTKEIQATSYFQLNKFIEEYINTYHRASSNRIISHTIEKVL